MTTKTTFDIYVDSNVAANAIEMMQSDVIPQNKTVRLSCFGGFDPAIGDGKASVIAIQWGFGTNWKTLRAGGGGPFEYNVNIEVVGDGNKRFRLVRKNNSGTAKTLICWLFAVII
jgi:hypothetical protein